MAGPLAPPQMLYTPEGARMAVVHSFSDGGQPPMTGLIGGTKVLLDHGTPARNDVFLTTSGQFVYRDGKLVDQMHDVGHIPAPFHEKAVAQVTALEKGQKPPKAAPVAGRRAQVVMRPTMPSKRDGRPVQVFDPAEAIGEEARHPVKVQ